MPAIFSIEPVNDSVMIVICDPDTENYTYIHPRAFASLASAGTKVLRSHGEPDGEKGRGREPILGRWDGTAGVLHIARGRVGAPVAGPQDITSKIEYEVPPEVVDAFILVASAVSTNSKLVKATVRKPKASGTAAAVEI